MTMQQSYPLSFVGESVGWIKVVPGEQSDAISTI